MSYWTQVDFDKWYSPVKARVPIGHAEFGKTFNYGWKYFAYGSRLAIDGNNEQLGYTDSFRWVTSIANRSDYTPANKALIVGCGIGATVHKVLLDYPSAKIWGADTSPYIHTLKNINTPSGFDTNRIINLDIIAQDALATLKPFTGGNGKVDWVICELVTETIPSVDRAAWFTACESLLAQGGKVLHIVMSNTNNEPIPNEWETASWAWQTISEWSSERPNHYFVDANDPDNTYYVPA